MQGGSTPRRFRFVEVAGILLDGRRWRSWQPIRLSAVTAHHNPDSALSAAPRLLVRSVSLSWLPFDDSSNCAVRSRGGTQGGALDDDVEVLLETYYKDGDERTVMFQGRYGEFKQVPDQRASQAAVALQKRAESGEDYVIRLGVTVPEGGPLPDLEANDTYFELDCVKLWWNESA